MDLAVEGRHALLFDDDATAAFVNSRDALVPWSHDPSLLIDRYDVRHLLDRMPPRPSSSRGGGGGGASAEPEIDQQRYLDLHQEEEDDDDKGGKLDSDTRKGSETAVSDAYQAVPFSYGNSNDLANAKNSDSGHISPGFRPPFHVPESLLSKLPPSEKLHQIMARTALFVSEHGGQSEIVLRVKQGDNPTFGFLMPDHHLHAYFRYLVDHPQLVKNDSNSSQSQEANRVETQANEACDAAGGALSLLGSAYGSVEDDDVALHKESKEVEPPRLSVVSKGQGESSISSTLEDKVAAKHVVAAAKEKISRSNRSTNASSSSDRKKNREDNSSFHGASDKGRISQSCLSNAKPLVLEPPSFLKRMMEKIIEFIVRNGKEFESVLIEQDKTVGRFSFLLPSNQYHSFYLKLLQEARESKLPVKNATDKKQDEAATKKRSHDSLDQESTAAYDSNSIEEGLPYDPHRKEKFRMVIGGSKKESQDQHSKPDRQSGATADEAAAIVLAATRGRSPADAFPTWSTEKRSTGSNGSFSSLNGYDQTPGHVSRHVSHNETGTSLTGAKSSSAQSDKKDPIKVDDVVVAKAVAKTAALAVSREADSSEACLTKEQKLKAERLKRAKMFAAMIKDGGHSTSKLVHAGAPTEPLEAISAVSNLSAGDSDPVAKEREGSSAYVDAKFLDALKTMHADTIDSHNGDHRFREKHLSRSRDREEDSEEDHKHSRKKHRSEDSSHYESNHRRHQKRHSLSKDKNHRHHHGHHSSSDDEHRHRKSHRSRHRHRDHDHSEDENGERKRSDRHHRRSHSQKEKKPGTKDEENTKIVDQSELSLSNHIQDVSTPAEPNPQTSDTTDVPSDLRAKIRAMLLETM